MYCNSCPIIVLVFLASCPSSQSTVMIDIKFVNKCPHLWHIITTVHDDKAHIISKRNSLFCVVRSTTYRASLINVTELLNCRYCVKTTERSTVQFAPLDSKNVSSFVEAKKYSAGTTLPLKFWLKVTYPLLKAASFDTSCLVAVSYTHLTLPTILRV